MTKSNVTTIEDNCKAFRSFLGDCASNRTVCLAATAMDALDALGVPEEIKHPLASAIREWEAQRYQKREARIRQLEKDALSVDCKKMICEEQ
jgi:hypothetical protein